jgi:hypothetical protein
MRKVLLLLSSCIFSCLGFAQSFNTPILDGVINSGEYGSHTSGNNNLGQFYMTWDNDYLYIGITNSNRFEGAVVYLDKDLLSPINGGNSSNGTGVGFNYDNTSFAELPFRADAVLYFKNGYQEYRTANGSDGWSGSNSFPALSYWDEATNTREQRFPWSVFGGRPSSFAWFGYVTSGGGVVYNQVPTENGSGSIGTSARYSRYFTVSSTSNGSSTFPFSRNSYVFTGTSDINSFGSISVYDFTMNTSGRTITKTAAANWTINGNLVVGNGTISFANPTGICEISEGVHINVGGTLDLNNSALTLKSTSSGTARIATVSGTLSNASNVTVERYVPAKTARKWSYVASPVTVTTIRQGWQDDVFISGPGTGGTICGSTAGDGVAGTDKYNNNGFDVTPSNTPSMFTYNVTQVNGTRWVSIPNTNATALTPGKGYRLNLRGVRGNSDANCGDQLNSTSPSAPAALTLSATGTLAQGDVPVSLNAPATHLYTLIGNPYASEVSFTAFQSDATANGGGGSNNANISNKFWAYSSQSSTNNFATYNAGTTTNFPVGNSSPAIIASGQAIFVEASSGTANANVVFRESHKSSTTQNGNTMFRSNNWTELIRVKYSDGSNNHLDEIVIRFGNDPLITTNENAFDAVSFNSGTYLAGRKANKGFAIQTRPTGFVSDTVRLTVAATDAGNYKLNFSEFDGLISAPIIQLIDHYTNTVTDVRLQTNYSFSIDANLTSQGTNRFELVFRNNATLPVRTIAVSAKQNSEHTSITWTVTGEYNIDSYVVEKSVDGRNFKPISKVAANNQAGYSYNDKENVTGTCYYRIRINDKNGSVSYSTIVKLESGKAITVHLYPNPAKDQLNIITNSAGNEIYTLRILNMHGKTLYQTPSRAVNGMISINTDGFSPGMYTVHVVSEKGEVITERFVKQ